MPPAQRCAKRRSLVIRFKEPTAITLIAASVKVDDKPALAVPEGRLPGRYRLRRLPKREVFAVKVAASLADGRRLQRSRFYRSCRPRPKR